MTVNQILENCKMNIIIAMDSFKGSLTTFQAGEAAANGIRRTYPDAEIIVRPLADGGEGTMEAVIHATQGTIYEVNALGPLGESRLCRYGFIPKTNTAVIEICEAAGITLVKEKEKNPLHTTTYGVGQMIKNAIERGIRKFIIGLGGSATNDGGVGMLQALV